MIFLWELFALNCSRQGLGYAHDILQVSRVCNDRSSLSLALSPILSVPPLRRTLGFPQNVNTKKDQVDDHELLSAGVRHIEEQPIRTSKAQAIKPLIGRFYEGARAGLLVHSSGKSVMPIELGVYKNGSLVI
jgi:hypothetical protein